MLPNKAGLQIVQHRQQKHVLSLKKNCDFPLFSSELADSRIENGVETGSCESTGFILSAIEERLKKAGKTAKMLFLCKLHFYSLHGK